MNKLLKAIIFFCLFFLVCECEILTVKFLDLFYLVFWLIFLGMFGISMMSICIGDKNEKFNNY